VPAIFPEPLDGLPVINDLAADIGVKSPQGA
jgi:hypothetical protein